MRLFVTFVFFILTSLSFSQKIIIDTYSYTSFGDIELDFDLYRSNTIGKENLPTILFVHGGSFMHGNKNLSYIPPFAHEWVSNGFNFVAINYRLTLKGKTFHCDCPSEKKIKTFEHSVYDIRSITNHLIENAKKYNIDNSKIILAGNSAGAEAVLHAAYWNNDEHNIGEQLLSKSFKFAGVLAYAGAIVDTNLITKKNAIPTALFHGTCDKYVPYRTAPHHYCPKNTPGALMLNGSFDIMKRLKNLNKSYFMYTLFKGKHKVNTLGMDLALVETIDFVKKSIGGNDYIQQHKVEKSSKEKCNFVEIDFCE